MSDDRDPPGFSEEALRGLADLENRAPPPDAWERSFDRALPPGRSLGGGAPPGMREGPAGRFTGPAPASDGTRKRPHYWGHRERLRTRFLESGEDALPDYELLEMLLFNAIPRIDVKPLAKELLAIFGDFNAVISASRHRLLQVEGVTPKVCHQFRLAAAIARRMARAEVLNRSVIGSWTELITYCKTAMAHRETEHFRVLFLDRKNILIADEEQAKGTVDHVPVYPREVAKRALELNASSIILVHNHPSGDPTPSKADVDMTHQIEKACRAIGVTIHDHVVIGKGAEASLRMLGLF